MEKEFMKDGKITKEEVVEEIYSFRVTKTSHGEVKIEVDGEIPTLEMISMLSEAKNHLMIDYCLRKSSDNLKNTLLSSL